MPEKDLNIEQVPIQRSTTTVLQHPSEIDIRKQAKQRVTQEHEEAMEKIRNRPDPDLPDWFHTLLYNLNTEDPIQNAWANNLFRSQYDKRYNEYLEQHSVPKWADAMHAASGSAAFPGDATFSNFSMSPSHLNEEDAYKYAVEKSGYDPGNPNDFWRQFDKENDKIKAIGATAAVGLPLMYTIGAGGFGIIPKTLMDLSFGYSSYKNFTGPEGWRKTLNLLKNGKYGKAALSGLGDMVDISLMSPIAKEMIRPIKNFGKEIFDIAKFNYINRGNGFRMDYPWQRTSFTTSLNPKGQLSIYNPAQIIGHFGKVKYYGPTMGKTTAAAVNSKLVDFDDIIRQPSRNILDRYGFKNKSEMYNSGNQEAIKAYEDMLVKSLQDWRANPENANLTLVASPTAIANPANTGFYFDNIPSIPSRDVFIARNVGRGGTPEASALWYDSLIRKNPNLKIDNRFVSQIEKQPYQSPTTSRLEMVPQRAFASDIPTITKENAASVTNAEWDAAYNKAVQYGNMDEVQRLRDLHWRIKAPNAPQYDFYHGTLDDFNQFEIIKPSEQLFHFGDLKTASVQPHNKIIKAKLNITSPLEVKDAGRWWWPRILKANPKLERVLGDGENVLKLQEQLTKQLGSQQEANFAIMQMLNKDAFAYRNFVEGDGGYSIAVPKSSQIKLSGPITYDDSGRIIPLSKRDDFGNPDMRFGVIPITGAIALGASAINKEKCGGKIEKHQFGKIVNGVKELIPVKKFESLIRKFPVSGKGNVELWEAAGVDMSQFPKTLPKDLEQMQFARIKLANSGNFNGIVNLANKNRITSYFNTNTGDNRLGYIDIEDLNDGDVGIRWIQKIQPLSKFGLDPYTVIGTNAAKDYVGLGGQRLVSGRELLQPKKTIPYLREYFNNDVKKKWVKLPEAKEIAIPIPGKYHETDIREAATRQLIDLNSKFPSENEINFLLGKANEGGMTALDDEYINVSSFPQYFDETGQFRKDLDPDFVDQLSVFLSEGRPGFYQQYIGPLKKQLMVPNKLITPFIHPNVYLDQSQKHPNLGVFSTFKFGGTIKKEE